MQIRRDVRVGAGTGYESLRKQMPEECPAIMLIDEIDTGQSALRARSGSQGRLMVVLTNQLLVGCFEENRGVIVVGD